MSQQKPRKKRRRKYNAETIRLAKKIPFTAQELQSNQNEKLTPEQAKKHSRRLWLHMIIAIIGFTVCMIILMASVVDYENAETRRERRYVSRGIAFSFTGAIIMGGLGIISLPGIIEVHNHKIRVYSGKVRYSQQSMNNDVLIYLHIGNKRLHIDDQYHELFKEGYEYKLYYLRSAKIILSAEATDPAFNALAP